MAGLDQDKKCSRFFCQVSAHLGKPCVAVGNASIQIKISTSGGAIVAVTTPETGDDFNPLWEPPWKTVPVGVAGVAADDALIFSQDTEHARESRLLASIGGLALDENNILAQ